MGPRQDQGPDPSGQDKMAKEVSVPITSGAAFAKTRMPGCERMQAGRARPQERKKEYQMNDYGGPKGACKVFAEMKQNQQVHGKTSVKNVT